MEQISNELDQICVRWTPKYGQGKCRWVDDIHLGSFKGSKSVINIRDEDGSVYNYGHPIVTVYAGHRYLGFAQNESGIICHCTDT